MASKTHRTDRLFIYMPMVVGTGVTGPYSPYRLWRLDPAVFRRALLRPGAFPFCPLPAALPTARKGKAERTGSPGSGNFSGLSQGGTVGFHRGAANGEAGLSPAPQHNLTGCDGKSEVEGGC